MLSAAGKPARKQSAAGDGKIDFARQIQPIFQAKCFTCHGPEKQESDFRLDNGRKALQGGENGKAIVPGKSGSSPLILRVSGLGDDERMPPEGEGTPLSEEQIALLRTWIDQGAVWPASADAKLTGKGHWSFLPIRRPPLPKVKNRKWIHNGIDAFVLDKLEHEGVAPSPEADRSTLIRRLYLDLIGLPPSPAEWDTWMTDKRSDWREVPGARHASADSRELSLAGRCCSAAYAGGSAAAQAARQTCRPPRSGPLAGQQTESADAAGCCQPGLVASFRPGNRGVTGRLRHPGRETDASATARLARLAVPRERLEL